MKLGQAFKMAAKSIFSNIGRSVLTMLGIIIGLAAVIILVSYAQGQNAAMRAYYESMGTNTVEVYAYTWDSSLDVSKSLYNYCLGLDNLVAGVTPNGQVSSSPKISYGSKTLPTDDYQTATTLYLGNDQYGLCNDYWAPPRQRSCSPSPTPWTRPSPSTACLSGWWGSMRANPKG